MLALPVRIRADFSDLVFNIYRIDEFMVIEVLVGGRVGLPVRNRARISKGLIGAARDDIVEFFFQIIPVLPGNQALVIPAIKCVNGRTYLSAFA